MAASTLKMQPDVALIPDILFLHYLENTGAAFGIFRGKTWLFYILTGFILILLAVIFIRIFTQLKQYPLRAGSDYKEKTVRNMTWIGYILAVMAAGASGNLLDRILHGYVIDFIDFRSIGFPVFNIADIYVVISCIIIVIFFLFVNKDDPNFHIFSSSKSS